jgi:Siphovirus ReqiPepy6 Gp37-like protein
VDFFKFTDPVKTNLVSGEGFSGYTSAMWVERYSKHGEFQFVAPLSSGLMDILPKGTLVSHLDTLDVGIVQDHHVREEGDLDPILTITGPMLTGVLDHRVVGANEAYVSSGENPVPYVEYTIAAAPSHQQAVTLINTHIVPSLTDDDNDALDDNIHAMTVISSGGTSAARTIKRGLVSSRLFELLAVDDLGVRTVRRNPFGGLGNNTRTYFVIHKGVDRSDQVSFSWHSGELERAEYLWSIRGFKNTALVQGRYVEVLVYSGSETGIDRRVMLVDASDIDGNFTSPPAGGTLTSVRAKMAVRGQEALAAQKELSIASTDISRLTQYRYRKDYDIGDIVSVEGNYGAIEKRRVVEFVEIEDETGESGHPTLEVLVA